MDHSYEETRLNISTDDTLVQDRLNYCDVPQEIHESENECGGEEFPRKFTEPWNFGLPSYVCVHCGSILWYEERIVKSKRPKNPKFSLYCMEGKVKLPLLKKAPSLIDELLDPLSSQRSKIFRTLIRSYNAMFSLTSMGGKVDNRINDGRGPYVFKLNGQNHHRIGILLSNDGQDPQFVQLYFYDTKNEVQHRMNVFSSGQINSDLDPSIVVALVQMFDESNSLVKIFRMSRDCFIDTNIHHLRLRLIGSQTINGREYNLPTCSEIAAIVVGDIGAENAHHDIIVKLKGGLQHINVLHPSYMALQYPLLFPYGEDGFRLGILYSNVDGIRSDTTDITMREYYAYRLQEREHEGHTSVYGRRLFQQFDVDAYTCIEEIRLMWEVEDRPDVVARVFKIKLVQLLHDLKHGQHFGKVIAVVYTVEYQKRGLPHAHILLFLHHDDKHPTAAEIDRIISAEIPDLNEEPLAYETVKQYMVHGPYGSINSRAGCMIDNKCTKHFLKKFCLQTTIDEDGFPIYRRRNNGRFVERNEAKLDNRYIVPHNIDLLVKFQAHINVEWCNCSRSIKYLFKYITKGPDRATLILEENLHIDSFARMQHMTDTNEVKTYLNCRYVSAIKACWRIFEFTIHHREPTIQRLSFHNEDEQPVVFEDIDYLNNVVDNPDIRKSKFTEWMKANALYEEARELTYSEFPTKWVWHGRDKEWKLRKSGRCIGCIYYDHPTSGEWFYLRMLLNVIKGARSFEQIRNINSVVYPTFKSACCALGLLNDDKEWHETLNHTSYWASGKQLRELFVTMLIFCEVADPYKLWISNWQLLSEDILHRQRTVLQYDNLHLDDFQLQNYALCEIEQILINSGRSLHEFETIPYPNTLLLRQSNNRVLQEELDYDRNSLAAKHIKLLNGLNIDQRNIYDEVIDSVLENKGGFFFVYGHGGTGKTYHWKTIICRLCSEGKIVIVVASSRIGVLLLLGGRTAHSRFQIPINVTDSSTCGDIAAREFAEWILKIGDGELSNSEGEALIEILHDLLIQLGAHPFNDIVTATYPDFDAKFNDSKYLEERAILAPTNEVVEDINGYMIDLFNVDEETYLSVDSLCKASSNILDQDVMYSIEFLNSLKFPESYRNEVQNFEADISEFGMQLT
uniref:ATP-dependent DNA helicase n=1 Tax=Quercus lobata TaxID=97700 RepID=A0A7N2MG30_QUELO